MSLHTRSHCTLCARPGRPVYEGLSDLWYGTSGVWSVLRCVGDDCGLAWLSPYPDARSSAIYYADYYTHPDAEGNSAGEDSPRRSSLISRALSGVHALTGLARARRKRALMYLAQETPGKLLELGCGDGARLLQLKRIGWAVEGQEVDPAAARAAAALADCTVHLGEVGSLDLEARNYDAIVMNHVLEHVVDPQAVLECCASLLKPGGLLICAVPNLEGDVSREFGRNWWGIDAPRHLYHFSEQSLGRLATRSGLTGAGIHTTVCDREQWLVGSYFVKGRAGGQIQPGGRPDLSLRLLALSRQYLVFAQSRFRAIAGDECILRWQKPLDISTQTASRE